MLKQLKEVLNSYSDKELEDMELWVNSNDTVNKFVVDDNGSIDLITTEFNYKVFDDYKVFQEKENK